MDDDFGGFEVEIEGGVEVESDGGEEVDSGVEVETNGGECWECKCEFKVVSILYMVGLISHWYCVSSVNLLLDRPNREEVDGGVEVDKDGGLEVGAHGYCFRTRVSAIWIMIMCPDCDFLVHIWVGISGLQAQRMVEILPKLLARRFRVSWWLGFDLWVYVDDGFGGGAFRSAATVTTLIRTPLSPQC
ncbi:hypothetical protein V8G54_032136 [Vigna mungo]|uniref:Uncharacterized protein n=1 Tax=Vigna mungo TaxID=3915 RepID=A0AAQ3RF26_VIGMU